MRYGDLPKHLGCHDVNCQEMMFYQYLPIKLAGTHELKREDRLSCFDKLLGTINCDFIGTFGLNRWLDSYVYLTAKRMWQEPNVSFNRTGFHTDGFGTPDINYIWSDCKPTIFNCSKFNLSEDEWLSMFEMGQQADKRYDVGFADKMLLRLNQYNVHKVGSYDYGSMRTFVKVSISKDKYDLVGNSHNYLLDYEWPMRPRQQERNIPQQTLFS